MHIVSTAFQDGEPIPVEHSLDGGNVSPPLTFSEVPAEAKSLVLIVEDPDAPNGTFTHWILYNMSPATLQILPGQPPMAAQQATNDFGQQSYSGPQPPSGTHHYVFKLFALSVRLDNVYPTDRSQQVYAAMADHVIDKAQLTGTFTAN